MAVGMGSGRARGKEGGDPLGGGRSAYSYKGLLP